MIKLALININVNQDPSPPTGLASIATYLEKKIISVKTIVIDSNFENPIEKIKQIKPDVIGISSMTVEYYEAIQLAKKLRKITTVPLILGGIHISTLKESLNKIFDIGVVGEGEETMLELMKHYNKNKRFITKYLKQIKSIVYWEGKKIKSTELRLPIKNLDDIPFPNKNYIHSNYFRKKVVYDKKLISHPIMTSRGCPYKCIFCSTSKFWQTIRFNSAKHVVKEIKDLVENYKVNRITIWDDLFTVRKDRLKEIIKLMKKKRLLGKVTFECMARANTIDEEICVLLKRLGVVFLNFGFESGNPRVLKMLKQNVTPEQNKNAILLAKKYGFYVFGSLIFGTPSETIKEMKDTIKFIDFAIKNKIDGLWTFVMTPFPSTQVWEIAKQRNKVNKDMDWSLLSHQNLEKPLLLDSDISIEKFRQILFIARKKLNKLRVRQAMKYILADPLNLIKEIINRPKVIYRSFFQIAIQKNKYNI